MIGKLKGIIDQTYNDRLIIDVSGVGYLVYVSARTLDELSRISGVVQLHIETHVREDHIHLYGFLNEEEREWFLVLTTVKGVGNKVALAILSALSGEQLSVALASQDHVAFTAVSGIGKKLAERIVSELKDKAGSISLNSNISLTDINNSENTISNDTSKISDAVLALTSLGYGRSEAMLVASKIISQHENLSVEQLIKESLQQVSKKY